MKDWSCPFEHCPCIIIYYYIENLRYIHVCSSQSPLKCLHSLCVSIAPLFAVLPLEIPRTTRPNQKTSKINGSEKVGTRRCVIISSHDFIKRRDTRPWQTASPMVRVRSMYSLGYLVWYLMTLLAFSLFHCTTQVPFHWSWLILFLFHSLLWLCSFFPWSYDKLVTTSI